MPEPKFSGFSASLFTMAAAAAEAAAAAIWGIKGLEGPYDSGGPSGASAGESVAEILLVALDLDLDRGGGSPNASMATGLASKLDCLLNGFKSLSILNYQLLCFPAR